MAQELGLLLRRQERAKLVNILVLDQRGNIPGPQLQLFGKVAAQIVDKVEPAEVLAYKTDGQLFFSMYGSSVCSDAAGMYLVYSSSPSAR